MKKLLATLLAVLMLALPLAVSAETATEPLKVGLSFVSMNFPYFVRMYDQYMADANARGWEVTFVDGNLDASTQINGLQDMINNGIQVLCVSTFYSDALEDICKQCEAAGIPVLVIGNSALPENILNLVDYACGTDHYDAGYLGGVWAAKYFNGIGKTSLNMVIMTGSTEQMIARGQGFVDAMTAGGITVNVYNWYDINTREEAMASAEDALVAYDDLDLIYGCSAQGSLGGYDATIGANRSEVYVVGYDGEDEEIELIDKGTNYIATITQNPTLEATTTVEYVEKILAGESFEKVVPIPAGVYCAEGQLTSEQVLAK